MNGNGLELGGMTKFKISQLSVIIVAHYYELEDMGMDLITAKLKVKYLC